MESRKRQRDEEKTSRSVAEETAGDAQRKSEVSFVKRFKCNYEGCGKVYSRAEHLERHTLNRM